MNWRKDYENSILWSTSYDILTNEDHSYTSVFTFINELKKHGDEFKHGRHKKSLDNVTGVICYLKYYGYEEDKKHVPLFKSNFPFLQHYVLHPKDFIFLLYYRYPLIGFWFMPIVSLAMIVSCWQRYKVRNGHKMFRTDGKILAHIRLKAFNMPLTAIICTWIIKNRHRSYIRSWKECYEYYHGNRWSQKEYNKMDFDV